jgi:hypothetical protein
MLKNLCEKKDKGEVFLEKPLPIGVFIALTTSVVSVVG